MLGATGLSLSMGEPMLCCQLATTTGFWGFGGGWGFGADGEGLPPPAPLLLVAITCRLALVGKRVKAGQGGGGS